MAQYINKDAFVAEIAKQRQLISPRNTGKMRIVDIPKPLEQGWLNALKWTEGVVNSLEVKEVDLEKELNDFIEQQKAWVKDDRVVEYNNGDSFNHIYDLEPVAKHFFELGLKTQKGE